MKKTIMTMLCALMLGTTMLSAQEVMKKQGDGTYVVNTTTICNARGFKGATPLEVYIKSGKVVKVVPLKNQETRQYFQKVSNALLPKYNGTKVAKAKKIAAQTKVDGCTGATYSTVAVQKNIQAALDYYTKHK